MASLCSREPPPPPCPVCARAQECKWKARYYYATSLLVTPSFCGRMREGHGLEDAMGARLRGRRRESLRPDREAWSSKCNSGCNKPRLTRNNKRGEGGTPPSALQESRESVSRTNICMVWYVRCSRIIRSSAAISLLSYLLSCKIVARAQRGHVQQ